MVKLQICIQKVSGLTLAGLLVIVNKNNFRVFIAIG